MITIPPELSEAFGIDDGDNVILETGNNHIVLYRKGSRKHVWQYDHLIEMLPDIEVYCSSVDFHEFKKAVELSKDIRILRQKGEVVPPDRWFDLYNHLDWGAYHARIRVEFVEKLKEYISFLRTEYGLSYRIKGE